MYITWQTILFCYVLWTVCECVKILLKPEDKPKATAKVYDPYYDAHVALTSYRAVQAHLDDLKRARKAAR